MCYVEKKHFDYLDNFCKSLIYSNKYSVEYIKRF